MGGMGQAHFGSASGISARASRATDERRRSLAMQKFSSGSDTTKELLETWRGVVRGRTPKARPSERYTHDEPHNQHGTEDSNRPLRGGARSWGEDSFLPPNRCLPEPESPQAILARKRRLPRHLGASSPSGNARGGCRG